MESTCSDDLQAAAVVYCACRFPLVPLCQMHAEKHLLDSHGFHFTLPLTAYQVITSEEVYMQCKLWLFQLNTNYELLRKKFQLIADGEGQIDSAYQDLLHFASDAYKRLKRELSVKKEGFRLEIEKAITETSRHALEMSHQPMSVLSQLLWYYQPSQIVSYQLFTFQAQCIQEHLSSTFHIALNFAQGLEHLNMGKFVEPLSDQIEELTKQLQDAKAQEVRSQNELQGLNLKLQNTQDQFQTAQTENETLKKQIQMQTTQLAQYRQSLDETLKIKAHLEAQHQDMNIALQQWVQEYQTLLASSKLKDEHCLLLDREKEALESQVGQLEARLQDWGITTSPPIASQEPVPDYSTPKSRAAFAKFGPFDQDNERVLAKRSPVVEEDGVYIGQWNARNQKHGYGKYLWKSGDVYEGQWRNGQQTGRGRFIWADNGDVYVGDFVQDRKGGFGTIYFADGDEYTGTWLNDKPHGIGSKKFGKTSQQAGDLYIGGYLDGLRSGIGAYFWADGRMYVGSWKANKKHGKGLLGGLAEKMYFGDWVDDSFVGIRF